MLTLAALVKHIHVWLVILSVGGFVVRFIAKQTGAGFTHSRFMRIAPHVVDTLLLISGVSLAYLYRISPLQADWLAAKLALIVMYILLGALAMREPIPRRGRQIAGGAAIATVLGIIFLAVYKPDLF